ncbi:2-hydroxychromene-2-carboxylate isomerase [Xanthobacter autotrophicus]|jgi:2-hydroxychromene-2-carboxylate isomerase|uniref:2-hydroxychromene-2-carboxylate isomerase n=1 Tax=Xanthobacter autotrophicus TaxID=280 RepID=UPI0010FF7B02|nr:2-hydroxychromene-2-carboxylate isomerase [Starkeya sp.]
MSDDLHFYFDFMSPFSYLAFNRVPSIARRHGLGLAFHLVDLPKLKKLAGNTGPANVSIPIKIAYLRKDLDRWAACYGVPLVFPKSLDVAAVNAAAIFVNGAVKPERIARFVRIAWDEIWGEGADPTDPGIIERAARGIGLDPLPVLNFSRSEAAANELARATEAANAAGVFGAPTMIVGREMWWGNDRLDLMDFALSTGR